MMNTTQTIICTDFLAELGEIIADFPSQSIYILTDTHSREYCLPKLMELSQLSGSHLITIPSGDEHKNIHSVMQVWEYLSSNKANRNSLLINLGGGVVTDLGGFVAATFKRGIEYLNISTTLLGAVDAATGAKTGINFLGLKNEIGSFAPARAVLINVDFFRTLDIFNIRSGYAEMLKHALIESSQAWEETLSFDLDCIDFDRLRGLLASNIRIKERIVAEDPKEQGLRKALNLGHTFGHAFESLSYTLKEPLLHGYAVVWGLVCELYLSHLKLAFPQKELTRFAALARECYGSFRPECQHYEALLELMTHDKKNDSEQINFTLLAAVGEPRINRSATREEIFECLDFLREGC